MRHPSVTRRTMLQAGSIGLLGLGMNHLAPLLAPVFRWNHAQVMQEGERSLTQYLARRRIAEV